jgi:hypothetical protein
MLLWPQQLRGSATLMQEPEVPKSPNHPRKRDRAVVKYNKIRKSDDRQKVHKKYAKLFH